MTFPAGLPLQLVPGASLSVQAPRIDIDSSISAVAGNLSFENVQTVASQGSSGQVAGVGIAVGNGVTLDVSGQWTNDSPFAAGGGGGLAPTFQNGGAVNLQLTAPGSALLLGNDAALKADGGAWLGAGGALTYGKGGAIRIDASPSPVELQFGNNLQVEAFGTGTASGGSFSLLAPRMDISAGDGSAWTASQTVNDLTSSG